MSTKIVIELSVEDAGCLNNAIRREIEATDRWLRAHVGNEKVTSDALEYERQLYACRDALAGAFTAFVHQGVPQGGFETPSSAVRGGVDESKTR